MRYNNFYPFQQLSAFPRQPLPPMNFAPRGEINPFSTFGGMLQQLPNKIPAQPNPTSKLDSFLQTADKLFTTAQNYTPYIQQAVPMVKNLPSIYRMYKGFQSLPDTNSNQKNKQQATKRTNNAPRNRREPISETNDYTIKPSKPRIFQPPFE